MTVAAGATTDGSGDEVAGKEPSKKKAKVTTASSGTRKSTGRSRGGTRKSTRLEESGAYMMHGFEGV